MDLGADYVATGHYCQKIDNDDGTFSLGKGLDPGKDQSYFLCQLSQEQLAKALFPIGELQKSEVRRLASEAGLFTADKKDSQGLCFVGKISLPTFLQQQLKVKHGPVLELPANLPVFADYETIPVDLEHVEELSTPFSYSQEQGLKVAEHQGAHFYTIGQRKGLQIGGRPEPSFVLQTDTNANVVYSGQRDEHPGLNRWALFIDEADIHYIEPKKAMEIGETRRYELRIRYRQADQPATLIRKEKGIYILFDTKQRGITPGQFAAWYDGEQLIGSGVIKS
jgi:tRNA-specific 2-thiouridylase